MPEGISVEISTTGGLGGFSSHVDIDSRALADYLRSDQGPVMRALIEAGDKVKDKARDLVGIQTGNLRDHIVKRITQEGLSFHVLVGADVDSAIYHHEGSDAVDGKLMRWRLPGPGRGGGGLYVFATKRRAIPGNPFLTDALAVVRI